MCLCNASDSHREHLHLTSYIVLCMLFLTCSEARYVRCVKISNTHIIACLCIEI